MNIKTLIALTTFLFFITISGQSQTSATIYGKVDNFTKDSIGIRIFTNEFRLPISYKSKVSSNGKFKISIPIEKTVSAYFDTGKEVIDMLISKGDSIYCYFNYNSVIESMKFSGNSASHYNYFVEYMRTYNLPHAMYFKPDYKDVFDLNPTDFKEYRKNKVTEDLYFLENYTNNNNVSNTFKVYCDTEIKYSFYNALGSYYSFKKFLTKKEENLPDDFYKELNDELFMHDEFLISKNYIDAMKIYIGKIKVDDSKRTGKYFYEDAFYILNSKFSGKSSYACQAKFILDLFTIDVPNDYRDTIVSKYIKKCPYPDYNIIVVKAYNKHLLTRNKNLSEEVLSTNLIDVNGNNITLDKLLKKQHKKK